MPKTFDTLQILLIQARDTEDIEQQEQVCFLERCRIEASQLRTVNVPHEPLTEAHLQGVDALLIGGAGEYSATKDYPWMQGLLTFIRTADAQNLPIFGSCWGHQLLCRAFGGTVEHDAAQAEFGCLEVELTEAGRQDPLFHGFPDRFKANMGHHDRCTVLPPGAVELARNSQPNQAFRLGARPVYGTQFHSELDAKREEERLIRYQDYYQHELGTGGFDAILASLAETTEVDHLLHAFLERYVVSPAPADA
ncbi:MAG: type 1 glutamine amidotransferase [Bacteroidota bacterium]